jgi:tripartite ATP-independent transporter DctM subunit
MEWWLVLLLLFASLVAVLLTGMPVAFAFLLINQVGVFLLWGGEIGLRQLVLSIHTAVAHWSLLAVPMFILMGEVLYHGGVVGKMMDAVDKCVGRLPGRLALVATSGGALLATLSGSAMGTTAMLGSTLVKEMERRGYKRPMILGPILGSGGLAIMIPPSTLAVILASIGEFSIGRLLIGIIVPGFLMAILYSIYIIIRCKLQPWIAPPYEVAAYPSLVKKATAFVWCVLPIGLVIFLVLGVIFLGVASPTEAAATGAFGCFILAALYQRGLKWHTIKKSVVGTMSVAVMIFMILAGSIAFSQILAFTGATAGFTRFALGFPVAPIFLLIAMQIVLLILGMFMDQISIMMITIPIFMPIAHAVGWDPVWFGAIVLLNLEISLTTPPFGLLLFVMKGVAPLGTTMGEICRAAIPFIICDIIVMGLMIIFPEMVLWLPGLML